MMVMEPDDQLQVKVRTCLGGHPGPEHLGMTWWQAEDRNTGRSKAGAREEHIDFGSIKVRAPGTSQWSVYHS